MYSIKCTPNHLSATHHATISLRKRFPDHFFPRFFPNGWKGIFLQPSDGAIHMDWPFKGIGQKMVGTNGEATIWVEMCTMYANESLPFRAKSLVNRRLMDRNSGRYIRNITASLHNTTSQRHAFTINTQKKAGEQLFRILFLLSCGTRTKTPSLHIN